MKTGLLCVTVGSAILVSNSVLSGCAVVKTYKAYGCKGHPESALYNIMQKPSQRTDDKGLVTAEHRSTNAARQWTQACVQARDEWKKLTEEVKGMKPAAKEYLKTQISNPMLEDDNGGWRWQNATRMYETSGNSTVYNGEGLCGQGNTLDSSLLGSIWVGKVKKLCAYGLHWGAKEDGVTRPLKDHSTVGQLDLDLRLCCAHGGYAVLRDKHGRATGCGGTVYNLTNGKFGDLDSESTLQDKHKKGFAEYKNAGRDNYMDDKELCKARNYQTNDGRCM